MRVSPRVTALVLCFSVASSGIARDAVSNRPYAGEVTLDVDLRDPGRKIFRVRERIPLTAAGTVTLYYPKWIPGEHSPSGPIEGVTGLVITTDGGKRVEWRRDLESMFTLHLSVPAGVTALDLAFDVLSPGPGGSFGQSPSVTERIEDLEWNQVVFYPSGFTARSLTVRASAELPPDWGYATALVTDTSTGGTLHFAPVSLEQLVDSPLITGRHFARLDLAPGARVPVHLDLVTDHDDDLKVSDAQLSAHRALVQQALALFGSQHYQHYDFLFTLSENTGHFGLEHSQSSDDRLYAKFFTDADTYLSGGGLLPHEYVHSWNGKFRRPAGLATADYNMAPMHGDLLWVYEGLTEYLGNVLTARSGIWTADEYRQALAATAAGMDHRPGRSWRNLQDTADAAQILYYTPVDWASERRLTDYYDEGELIWLDVDTSLRELSDGKHSLDDFVRAFFGTDDGSFIVKPYTFEDVVKALNAVQPHDWGAFLRVRLDAHAGGAPLGGIARGGWTLSYSDEPSAYFKAREKTHKVIDARYSLGVIVSTNGADTGTLVDVLWNSPAFAAGLAPGMKVIAVNGIALDEDRLAEALRGAKADAKPIEVLAQSFDSFTTYRIDYHGGAKYPQLTRAGATPDRLSDIVAAKPPPY